MENGKSNLDERQEQVLLRIEHNGFWLAFWGLLALMTGQMLLGVEIRHVVGEWILFLVLALYLSLGCLRNGIWDRRLKPDLTTNLLVSLVCALAAGVLGFAVTVRNFPDRAAGSMAAGAAFAVMGFGLCFTCLQAAALLLKKRQDRLEEEPREEEDGRT